MTTGREHEKSTRFWSLPFGLVMAIFFDMKTGIISCLAFFIGGHFLSPDLDTKSICLRRWGIFKSIWLPYRKLIPHRSILSHGLIIGTTIRLLYLLICGYLAIQILVILGLINNQSIINFYLNYLNKNHDQFVFILIGIELSSWLHLVKDGDPLLIRWLDFMKK